MGWIVFLLGFIPGIIIALMLPKGLQFAAMVVSGVASAFCIVMGVIYRKPRFRDESLGHAFKRFMWGFLATITLGMAVSIGFVLYDVGGEKETSNNASEQTTVEQTGSVK